ncbi:hypothetical protein KC19_2G268000 [Ceratodon purpureus]|uniref:Uncharacterized protein n=1 Tax=Ceratodon purpureus TaxID=3225 RepID=A0A8T0IYI4_CERPU|nr:hypothetical protein KC19_2G268000 [Ceratodon purpureus]KAG0588775.1 hypothetical protein KC19_2G268000 [Ceratodon purpureus]
MLKTEKQEQRQWEKEPERGEQQVQFRTQTLISDQSTHKHKHTQTEAAPKHQQIHAYSGCRSSLRLHLCALCTTADPASVSVAMASKGAPSAADREQIFGMAQQEMEYRVDLFNKYGGLSLWFSEGFLGFGSGGNAGSWRRGECVCA